MNRTLSTLVLVGAALGAEVTLVSGPVALADPPGLRTVRVDSADQMLAACLAAGAVDVAVCAAAVADWKMARPATGKIKKKEGAPPPALDLTPNPDILATLSRRGPQRPKLVVGFAAETENLVANAIAKRTRKACMALYFGNTKIYNAVDQAWKAVGL